MSRNVFGMTVLTGLALLGNQVAANFDDSGTENVAEAVTVAGTASIPCSDRFTHKRENTDDLIAIALPNGGDSMTRIYIAIECRRGKAGEALPLVNYLVTVEPE